MRSPRGGWGHSALALCVLALAGACDAPPPADDGGATDATTTRDASGTDASGSDGSAADGSTTDSSADANTPVGDWVAPAPITLPALPAPPDPSSYPTDPDGNPIIGQSPSIDVIVNPTPDAITARDRCAALISNCFQPPLRSMDECVVSVPICATSEPWNESACCAQSCVDGYAALRTSGVDPIGSALTTLYSAPHCMPGVDAMLEGT